MNGIMKHAIFFVFIGFLPLVFAQVPVPPAPAAPAVPEAAPAVPAVPVPPAPAVPAPAVPEAAPVVPAPVVPATPAAPAVPEAASAAPAPAAPVAPAVPAAAPVVVPAVPVAAPVPAPAAPVAAPATPAAPGAPAAQAAPAAAAQPAPEEKYKKEFDEIAEAMTKIKALEGEIKAAFNSFDEKITQARNVAIELKQSSFDILKQDTEQKSRELFAKMQGQLKGLKDIQKFGQGEFNKINTDKINEINTLVTKVTGILQQLQSLVAVSAQVSAASPAAAPTPTPAVAAKQEPDKKQPQASLKIEEKSMLGRAWETVTDGFVYAIMSFNRAIDWLTSWIRPQEKKKVVKVVVDQSLGLPELKKKAKELMVESEQVADPLETLYFDLVNKFQDASKGIQKINETISKMPSLKEYLAHSVIAKKVSPAWKKALVQMFSKVIDLGIALADAAVNGARVVYAYTFEPLVKIIKGDVEKKVKAIEQGK